MRTFLLILVFIFFIGCSQSNINSQTQSNISKIEKKDDFDELDRIDAKMEYELSPGSNTMKQLESCPIN